MAINFIQRTVFFVLASLISYNVAALGVTKSHPFSKSMAKSIKAFHCSGKLPNWYLDLSSEQFNLQAASPEDNKLKIVRPEHAAGLRDGYLRVYKTESVKDHKPITIVIEDNPDGCTDGEAPAMHGYNSIVVLPNKVFVGCCDSVALKTHRKLTHKR